MGKKKMANFFRLPQMQFLRTFPLPSVSRPHILLITVPSRYLIDTKNTAIKPLFISVFKTLFQKNVFLTNGTY
jgi:hypothetical protein